MTEILKLLTECVKAIDLVASSAEIFDLNKPERLYENID